MTDEGRNTEDGLVFIFQLSVVFSVCVTWHRVEYSLDLAMKVFHGPRRPCD